MLIQFFLISISIVMVLRVGIKWHRKETSFTYGLLWILLWSALGVIALYPNITNYLAHSLGVGRGADLAIYFAIILLYYLFFKLFIKIEKMEKNITKLTRAITLENEKSKK